MMDNQALVDALIKYQSWCDNWPNIQAEIDAQAAENAALRARLAEAVEALQHAAPIVGQCVDRGYSTHFLPAWQRRLACEKVTAALAATSTPPVQEVTPEAVVAKARERWPRAKFALTWNGDKWEFRIDHASSGVFHTFSGYSLPELLAKVEGEDERS